MAKLYKNETRTRITKLFDECNKQGSNHEGGCSWLCSECKLSDRYEKETGVRIEDLDESVL